MTKHIGIVACTAEGAALCYLTICREGGNLIGAQAHPEITMHTSPLREYMRCIEKGDWNGVANLMSYSAATLALAGTDFIICPDNTIHQAFEQVVKPLPWLHIAEEVAAEAARRQYQRVGVLGTQYLMEGPVYPSKLAALRMEHLIPALHERVRIHDIIFNELIPGQCTDESRAYVYGVIGRMKAQGCDAVILGCTELPLLVSDEEASLPLLDSTRILARAALFRATSTAFADRPGERRTS